VRRRKSLHPGLFGHVVLRAIEDALYERLIDRCWDEIRTVFERPDVREAEATILRAIAEAFLPNGKKKSSRRRASSQRSR
jgi:hypothetical protein